MPTYVSLILGGRLNILKGLAKAFSVLRKLFKRVDQAEEVIKGVKEDLKSAPPGPPTETQKDHSAKQ